MTVKSNWASGQSVAATDMNAVATDLNAATSKLSGIAAGATANSSDAVLKNRGNHTGTQTASTISDLTEVTQDIVGSLLVEGANVTLDYDDAGGTLTISSTGGGGGGYAPGGTDVAVADGGTGASTASGARTNLGATEVGDAVFTAADQAAARTAIGAGTSNLALGTTGSTAKAGDYQPAAASISDATTVGRAVLTAADAAAARTAIGAGSGGGDASTNTATSVDSEVAVFSGTTGKTLKRATGTGIAKLTSGVLSTASAGDFPTLNQDTTGSAAKLATARTVQTNLASTSSASFDGSANITPGVTGTLPVANGGTGAATLTGIVKGNGTSAMTAATAGTDYQAPITLTTTGTSGAATLVSGTLNIPQYSAGGGGDASTNTATSVDSEIALFSGTAGKTLKRATGTGLAKLASGVLSTATAGTDYYAPGSTDVAVADGGTGVSTLTGIVKGNGTSAMSAATAGTDYVAPGGALGTPSSGTLTNCTGLPIAGGGTGASTAIGALTNLSVFATTATAAGTTTLTVSSHQVQVFTGTSTQTVLLPTTSIPAGAQYIIINQSTGAVAVQSSGANTVATLAPGVSGTFMALVATPTTAANWHVRGNRAPSRVLQVSNVTSWTVDSDAYDYAENTGITGAITLNNPTGTPAPGQRLWVALTGTAARAITYGTAFEDGAATRPTTTVTTQRLDIGFIWNPATSKWRCMAQGSA